MKINKIIWVCIFGIALLTFSFRTINQQERSTSKQDTTYYHVYIKLERLVREEFIKTYESNSKLAADIFVVRYQEFSYIGVPTTRNYLDSNRTEKIVLSSGAIDTLTVFRNMVRTNSIRHNQGTKFAGRYGAYDVITNGDTLKSESRELYSLVSAINVKRK